MTTISIAIETAVAVAHLGSIVTKSVNAWGVIIVTKTVTQRRFPAPWTAELTPNCLPDVDGQQLAYVYFEDEPEIGGKIIDPR